MDTYDIEIRDLRGHIVLAHRGLRAPSEGHAMASARAGLAARAQGEDCVLTCFRRGRVRGRTRVATEYIPGGGDDGLAGVREPRRPLPDPGHLAAEAPLPERH